jgi:hypothetical protein
VLGYLSSNSAGQIDAVLEAFWTDRPGSVAILVVAVEIARHLEFQRMERWADRLRDANLREHCPLRAMARNVDESTDRRLQAARACVRRYSDAEMATLANELAQVSPQFDSLSDVHSAIAILNDNPAVSTGFDNTSER